MDSEIMKIANLYFLEGRSLGCIIYELLFGKPPFLTSSLYELTRMIYAENIIFPPEIFFGDCRSFVKVCIFNFLYYLVVLKEKNVRGK